MQDAISARGDSIADESEAGQTGLELARPWPRFWARSLDVVIYIMVLAVLLGIMFPEVAYMEFFTTRVGDAVLTILILPLAMIVDAVILASFGTSIGKKIAGLSIVPDEGSDRSLDRMLRRNLECYVRGMALGIPLLNLFAYYKSYEKVEADDTTHWDDRSRTKVMSVPNEGGRTVVIAILVIAANLGLRLLGEME